MYTLKLEPKEVQLIQIALRSANLNMDESNVRGKLWMSMQTQLSAQMPIDKAPTPAPDGEGGADPKED